MTRLTYCGCTKSCTINLFNCHLSAYDGITNPRSEDFFPPTVAMEDRHFLYREIVKLNEPFSKLYGAHTCY